MAAPSPHEPLLEGFPVVIALPVQWGELDAYGHVNNTIVFRYFESARMAYLDRCGFLTSYTEEHIGAILHSTTCRFRRPLFHPDEVYVGTRVSGLESDRFAMEYRVVSIAQHALAAEGNAVIVCYDYDAGRKTTLPPPIRARIEALEGTA